MAKVKLQWLAFFAVCMFGVCVCVRLVVVSRQHIYYIIVSVIVISRYSLSLSLSLSHSLTVLPLPPGQPAIMSRADQSVRPSVCCVRSMLDSLSLIKSFCPSLFLFFDPQFFPLEFRINF